MELTTQPLSMVMTLNPALCASIAHARPVGPAPMTITSAPLSMRSRALGQGNVSRSCLTGMSLSEPTKAERFDFSRRYEVGLEVELILHGGSRNRFHISSIRFFS